MSTVTFQIKFSTAILSFMPKKYLKVLDICLRAVKGLKEL